MNEQLTEYYTSLIEHIKVSSDVESRMIEYEYLSYILELLSDAGEFDDYNIVEDGRDGAGRWLIDGYSFDENNFSLSIFGTIISSTPEQSSLSKREIEAVLKKLQNFLKKLATPEVLYNTFEPSSNCYYAAQFIQNNWSNIENIRFIILSNRLASDRMKEVKLDNFDDKVCSVNLWDLKRTFELEFSRKEREEMIIDLSDSPISCLIANQKNEEEKSILAVLPGEQLAKLYQQWGSRLLEQNVRSFLQHKGKVNKGIKATILHDPLHFFAYNNGLTTIASHAVTKETPTGTVITQLKDLQIVNGGQTTASLYSAFIKDKADLSNVSVQMKLTVISDNTQNLVSNISRYANSQNKVSDADLFSNHPFHIRLEEFSRRLWVPAKIGQKGLTHWFYERARGQYLDAQLYISGSKKKQFQLLNPRSQLLTKTDVAKIMNSWNCLPYEVSKGAQKNFAIFAELINKQWEEDDSIFGERYYRKLVCYASIFRALEKAIMPEEWYSGFRANIVTYAIARLSSEINKHNFELNIDLLWRSSSVSTSIIQLLLLLSQKINELLQANDRPIGNPSEYAKRVNFWDRVKEIDCDINDIKSLLITIEEVNYSAIKSQKTPKIETGISLQEKVMRVPKDVWQKIEDILHQEDKATVSQISILRVAMDHKKAPSEKQAIVLENLLNRYQDKVEKL
ncbi:AIPR protein [Frischella perrara]|uniref:AIPR protein n=1 Tax=Frischella perrara TaxID=1267021 RepID=A0A0A7S3I4_FRIPE|nr:AIPR family protein [Frischella perrara]AJA45973.1 AIPR protein [Frischella perrara]PWV58548.1 AIPR protein [Frischella perrara]